MVSPHLLNQDERLSAGQRRRIDENEDLDNFGPISSTLSYMQTSSFEVGFAANGVDVAPTDLESSFAKCCKCPNVISLFGERAFKCDCGHMQCEHCLVYSIEIDS